METIKFSYGYHVYKDDSINAPPLCWDGCALEFQSEEEAQNFIATMFMNREEDRDIFTDLVIKKDVLYYENFKDARNKVLYYTETGEETLI